MWQLVKLTVLLALVICSEASPKRYHDSYWLKKNEKAGEVIERLSEDVAPTSYNIQLTVLEENLKNGKFSGTVTIDLNVKNDSVKSFNIHAKKLDITELTLQESNKNVEVTHELDAEKDFLTITPSKPLSKGPYTLKIVYTGELSDTDMDGFYRSSYTEKDAKEPVYLATTQFEQIGARRAFPCFDEPAIKTATFEVTITHSKGYNALSNTKGTSSETADSIVTKFEKTPPMSTYLVAFIVSKFICVSGDDNTEVCGRPGTNNTMTLALEIAPKVLNAMKDLTTISYAGLGIPKMTQAAIPDFPVGAMENWGLVTYREDDLLNDENESSNFYKQKAVTVVSHEFAHHWFGDYITLDWWSDAFLNEGFATYFEYHAPDLFQPDWDLKKQFVVEQIQPVLVTDSQTDSVALHSDPTTLAEIKAKFNDIGYNKGGSILRMVEHFLTSTNFKLGIAAYLDTKPVGYPSALWKAFDDSLEQLSEKPKLPEKVSTIMENWTNKPGYPVLEVKSAENSTVTISQKRLLPHDSKEDKTQWYVPITYSTSKDNFDDTTTWDWLVPDGNLTIKNVTDWIVLNKQQVGFYRVNYDDTLLQKIKEALDNDISSIDEISRSQLVDDQLNLARLGHKTYIDVMKFLTFLKKDDSYYSWYAAFNGFSYLLKRTTASGQRKAVQDYIKELMKGSLLDVANGKENTTNQVYTLNQVLAQTWACNLDVDDCVNKATDLFNKLTAKEPEQVPANLRSFVYCTGLRKSTNPNDDYEFLWTKYVNTDLATEQVTILKALGCTSDSDLRQKYLAEALNSSVRLQDAGYVFQSVYSNDGIEDIIKFINDHSGDFEKHFGTKSTLNSLIATVADYITTQEQIDALSKVSENENLDQEVKDAIKEATTNAVNNLKEIKSLESGLKEYFDSTNNNGAVGVSGHHFISLAVASVVYFIFNLC